MLERPGRAPPDARSPNLEVLALAVDPRQNAVPGVANAILPTLLWRDGQCERRARS